MSSEAIILCGGAAKRLKPYLPFSKALAEIGPGTSLLQYQITWLKETGINRIILAIDYETHNTLNKEGASLLPEVECSIEKDRLGTGGAVRKALDRVESPYFYLMNVDDILLSDTYTPQLLLNIHRDNPKPAGAILLTKTRFPFGVVETSRRRVTGFRQKPILDLKVCAGHYTFTRKAVEKYFPEIGNFEDLALPQIAVDKRLNFHEFIGEWITINNLKQLEAAREKLKELLLYPRITSHTIPAHEAT